jgi:hypothetical protein
MSDRNEAKLTSGEDVLIVFSTKVNHLVRGGLGEKVAMT